MSNSSFNGGSEAPTYAAGRDVDALGPSDSTDSGSDIQGETQMATGPDNPAEWGALTADGSSDSDAMGTGERGSATANPGRDGADILPDRVFDPDLEAADDDELLASVDVDAVADDTADDDDLGDDEGLDDPDAARAGSVETAR